MIFTDRYSFTLHNADCELIVSFNRITVKNGILAIYLKLVV
jgi:hypothetical protein